jgi:FkbM family methyltransferase
MPPLSDAIRRSLAIYREDPARDAALDAFYAPLVPARGLAFDIGAHVGDRTACFRRLGARVVAVEPQPDLAALLRADFRDDPDVHVIAAAVGAAAGVASLYRNDANPTVSTLSADFVAAASGAPGWEGQDWNAESETPLVTFDALIAEHGAPDFAKIDVEGYEHEVLAGLSRPVRCLSFEFTTIQKGVATACLRRLAELGYTAFRASLGESLAFAQAKCIGAAEMQAWIEGLPLEANSGDVYAFEPR